MKWGYVSYHFPHHYINYRILCNEKAAKKLKKSQAELRQHYSSRSTMDMERAIGDLGGKIHLPSNLYANLSQRAVFRCQVNALKAMVPDLNEPINPLPRGSQDLGDGYVLL
jgi:hypothetical protein